MIPILYGGLMSVGIAYTLQVVAQKDAPPAHASIILSLETVFAAVSGWILLDEVLSFRTLIGCVLMLAGMLLVQLWPGQIRGTKGQRHGTQRHRHSKRGRGDFRLADNVLDSSFPKGEAVTAHRRPR